MFGGSNNPAAYQSFGFGATTDGVYGGTSAANGTSIQKTQAFGVRGAFNHSWDPYWSTAIFGSASWVKYPGNGTLDPLNGTASAAGLVCNRLSNGGNATLNGQTGASLLAAGAGYSCNPNFAIYQIGVVTRWTPVKNLTFSAEVLYNKLDQNMSGLFTTVGAMPATLAKPATTYVFKDQDTVSLNVRAQRNF